MFRSNVLVLLVSLLFVGACASTKNTPSGFLGERGVYSLMREDSELSDVMVYKAIPYPLASYDRYIVPPVTIYLNAEGKKRKIKDEDLRELAEMFRQDVIKALGARYQASNTPNERTAVLKLAITDTDPNIPLMNLHPGSLIIGGGLGGGSMEADLIDSVTGRRIASVMASSKGKRYSYGSGLSKWGHTKGVFEDWAKEIGERIEKAHG